MRVKNIIIVFLVCALLVATVSSVTRQAAAAEPTNILGDPSFEILPSGVWFVSQTYGNGTVAVHDNSNPHTGAYSARLSAINTTLQCASTECKDTVRAAVEQYVQSNTPAPLADLANTNDSFSAWWYVAPSTLLTYSLHIGLEFSDGTGIEYWYGHSDLTNTRYDLGPLPAIGSWFKLSRNLTDDIRDVVANPTTTSVTSIWFGAFGGSFMDCSNCPVTAHGETAWLDDVSLSLNIRNGVPVAAFTPKETAPLIVTFDASQSYEPSSVSGSITGYEWNFGDGTPVENQTSAITFHSYPRAGTYTVKLTVIDSNGATSSSSTTITVVSGPSPIPPLAPVGGTVILLLGILVAVVKYRRPKHKGTRQMSRSMQ